MLGLLQRDSQYLLNYANAVGKQIGAIAEEGADGSKTNISTGD
jgi:hypothetical protein